MKIIINLPKSATALAAMMLADEKEQEAIDAAMKQCEDNPTEIDMAALKTAGIDNSEVQAFNMGLALIAISKALEAQNNNKKAETEK